MAEETKATSPTVIGALIVGLAIGGGTGVALDPMKAEALEDISVAEMVAAKKDSTTKVWEKSDAVRESQTVKSYDIKPAQIDKDGKEISPAETLSVKDVEVPRAVVRPEQTIRVDEIPTGSTLRVVAFVDDKAVSEWVAPITEAPDAEKVTRASIQITAYDQVR